MYDLAFGHVKELLEDVYVYSQEWLKTRNNVLNIKQVADEPKLSLLEKYYLYCFIFMIEIEGSYLSWIRMLFYLVYNMKDGPIGLDEIDRKSGSELKDMLLARGVGDCVFEGYMDGHLRNAIAHGGFSYDQSNNEMNFVDAYKGKSWTINLTLEGFIENLYKITIIPDICYDIIQLLIIRDICIVHIES